jgi:hypothetical protein
MRFVIFTNKLEKKSYDVPNKIKGQKPKLNLKVKESSKTLLLLQNLSLKIGVSKCKESCMVPHFKHVK